MDGQDVELLLYAVVFGSGYSLYSVVRRRLATTLRFHTAVLALLTVASTAALALPDLRPLVAPPVIAGFALLSLGPSLVILSGRRAARARRFELASAALLTGTTLLGRPAALLSEARLYAALAASERGDEDGARRRLDHLVVSGGLTSVHGGRTLAEALPLAGARRWDEALAVLDAAPSSATAVLGIEARAAAETGDMRRALRALARLEARADSGTAVATARRGVLAAAGRAAFLAEARRGRAPVVAGPRGTADLALGRAHEALGELGSARSHYETAARTGRGSLGRDARSGLQRLESAKPRLAELDEEELDEVLGVEERCVTAAAAQGGPGVTAIATIAVTVVTALVSIVVFAARGADAFTLLAAGALSEPLVRNDGEWWRLLSTMLLHGGWLHLVLNLSCIAVVGVVLERRLGAARLLIVYYVSGVAGSLASVYLNATQIGVGASGGAMGLIGALLALLLRRPGLFDVMERRRWTSTLWAGLVATALIGLLEAETIDNAAHAVGAIAGALVALVLLPPRERVGPEARAERAPVRVAAALLAGLAIAAAYEAARGFTEWEGEQEVWADGARAVAPGWLRATHRDDGTVLLQRPPAEIAVLLGSSTSGPERAAVILEPESGFHGYFEDLRVPDHIPDEWVIRPEDGMVLERTAPEWHAGIRFLALRSGRAYALVRLPLAEEAASIYAPVVRRLRDTLQAVDGAPADDSGR